MGLFLKRRRTVSGDASPFVEVLDRPPTENEDADQEHALGHVFLRKDGGYEAHSAGSYGNRHYQPGFVFRSLLAAVRWVREAARHA